MNLECSTPGLACGKNRARLLEEITSQSFRRGCGTGFASAPSVTMRTAKNIVITYTAFGGYVMVLGGLSLYNAIRHPSRVRF